MPNRVRFTSGGTAVLIVLALFGAVAFASVSRVSRQQQAFVETNDGISSVQELLVASYEAERTGMSYLRTGSRGALAEFDTAKSRIEFALDDLRKRAEDRPRQRAVLDTLGQLIGNRISSISDAMNVKRRQNAPAAVPVAHADSAEPRGGMLPLIQKMREEELVVLAERTRLMSRNGQISRMVVLGGSIIAFLVAAVVLVPVRSENA